MILLNFSSGFFSLHTTHSSLPPHTPFDVSWFSSFPYLHSRPLESCTLMSLSAICMLMTLQTISNQVFLLFSRYLLGISTWISNRFFNINMLKLKVCPSHPKPSLFVAFSISVIEDSFSLFIPKISEIYLAFLFF